MRKIALLNAIGERYELNGGEIFFNTPKGLGMANQDEFADLENGFFQVVNGKNKPQASITGELVFLKWAYSRYKGLVDWMAKEDELVFAYMPEDTEYYRRVRVGQMTKSELEAGKWLRVPVEFQCLTPWYLPTAVQMAVDTSGDKAARYPFRLGVDRYGTAGGKYAVHIPARGHAPTGLRVRYTGAAKNLAFTLRGAVSGTEYGRCIVRGESLAGETTELCTQPRDSYVRRSGVDLLEANLVDIRHEPFFRAPNNEETVLQATADEGLTGEMAVEAYYYYRSV